MKFVGTLGNEFPNQSIILLKWSTKYVGTPWNGFPNQGWRQFMPRDLKTQKHMSVEKEGTSIGKIQKIERKNAKQTIKYSKKSSCIQHWQKYIGSKSSLFERHHKQPPTLY